MPRLNAQPMSLAKQRGVALLMVLGLLALLGSVVADLQFVSRVDIQMAYHARDELQAEYNALSALRLRALILKQANKIQQLTQTAAAMMPGQMMPRISQIMQLIPVECGLMNAITKQRDSTLDGQHADVDFFPGECMSVSESEHAKVPVNLLRATTEGRSAQVLVMLLGMLSDPRLAEQFTQDDRQGEHAESPLVLAQAITDWIDVDHTQLGNMGDEDRYYQVLKDPYRAKNAPFDSLAELQLVYGVNDVLYGLFENHVTIYTGNADLDLSVTPIDRILSWGMPATLRDGVGLEALLPALPELGVQLALVQQLAGGLAPLTVGTLKSILDGMGLTTNVVDPTKLNNVFSDTGSATWFTVLAEGRMGRAKRKIRAVLQAYEGQMYYVRVD